MICRLFLFAVTGLYLFHPLVAHADKPPVPLQPAAGTKIANPEANTQARAIRDFIASLPSRKDHRVLSGQFSGDIASMEQINSLFQQTGQWPALIGVDYGNAHTGAISLQPSNRIAMEYWNAGGLVTISAHISNPANPLPGGFRENTVDLDDVLNPQSPTHTQWMRELNLIAAGLQELKAARVVVLWRPFHEMNGGWFWWGKKSPAAFIRLWRHMFHYFSEEKHLDNLLWVYAPSAEPDAAAYYPGDAFVDLVGIDIYTDFVDPTQIKGYTELQRFGKPFGFTEFGPHGVHRPPGDYDYRQLITGLETHFPNAVFFLSWGGKWSPEKNRFAKEFFAHPRLLNRAQLPSGLVAVKVEELACTPK